MINLLSCAGARLEPLLSESTVAQKALKRTQNVYYQSSQVCAHEMIMPLDSSAFLFIYS